MRLGSDPLEVSGRLAATNDDASSSLKPYAKRKIWPHYFSCLLTPSYSATQLFSSQYNTMTKSMLT